LEAAAHKVFLLTLILILLPPKGGLGAQPQGFDFVFLPEGHHVHRPLYIQAPCGKRCLFLNKQKPFQRFFTHEPIEGVMGEVAVVYKHP